VRSLLQRALKKLVFIENFIYDSMDLSSVSFFLYLLSLEAKGKREIEKKDN